jgi:hypothetical protein
MFAGYLRFAGPPQIGYALVVQQLGFTGKSLIFIDISTN